MNFSRRRRRKSKELDAGHAANSTPPNSRHVRPSLYPQKQTRFHKVVARALVDARRKVHLPESALKKVIASWEFVKDDTQALGMDFFLTVFDKHPDLLELFPFGHVESLHELRNSKLLQSHAAGVMNTVGGAVAGLSNMNDLIPKLQHLGRIHTLVGVQPEHYDWLYHILVDTIHKHVGNSRWSDETQEAWETCYTTITWVMKDPSRHLQLIRSHRAPTK